MRLSFVLPGLLWPEPVLSDIVRDLRLPALAQLLGRGSGRRLAARDEDDFWQEWFAAPPLPAAPARLLDGGVSPGDAKWICLDPVHLRVDQQGIRLDDPAKLILTGEEADAIAAPLAPLWEGYGAFHISAAGWHLRVDGDLPPLPPRLSSLIGRPARELLPEGDAAKPWRRLMNELQMALHDHPVNQARQAKGQPAVTSLALWGAGSLENSSSTANPPPSFTVVSADPARRGQACHQGLGHQSAVENFHALPDELFTLESLVIDHPGLVVPTRMQDALAWRAALEALEADWLAPAHEALSKGKLTSLSLHGFGEQSRLERHLGKADRWKFWQGPAPLTELHP